MRPQSTSGHERIDSARIFGRTAGVPKPVSYLWAKAHMLFLCGRCSPSTRSLRDLDECGECWWWKNWKAGNYEIPLWMGRSEFRRLSAIRERKLSRGERFPTIGSLESAIRYQIARAMRFGRRLR